MARKTNEAEALDTIEVQPLDKPVTGVVAHYTAGGPPAELMEEMERDSGRGFSQKREDSVVPLVRVLQDLSPQVKPRDPAYIEGAQAGDFFIPANNRLIKGSEGMVVIPCGFHHEWVEWKPRGQGGIAAKYAIDALPQDAEEFMDKNRRVLKRGDNDLIETRYHFVLHEGQGYVIPFSSTGHQTSKKWTFMMSSKRLPNGRPYPGFACKYLLKTSLRKNADGEWYGVDVVDLESWTPAPEYKLARAMATAIETGAKVAEEDDGFGGGAAPVGARTDNRVDDNIPF
jgi:hypothetical protein